MIELEGNIVNVISEEVYPGRLGFSGEIIEYVERTGPPVPLSVDNLDKLNGLFILPGLVDGHIHIESSMLTPSRFGQIAVSHGTTSVISDPHEIANVLGKDGLKFMLEDALRSPINIYYTVPSCVPTTNFETSGASLGPEDIKEYIKMNEFVALGEMMNYPGVLSGNSKVFLKIEAAKKAGKPVDGHAPMLTGMDLSKYIRAGISTDHECSTLTEALEKIRLGMKIQVRQGSAARNLENLRDVFSYTGTMTVSDDRHPGEMLKGHMDSHLKLLRSKGVLLKDALRSMSINPCEHYGINSGSLVPGKLADIVVMEDLLDFRILATYVRGVKRYDGGNLPSVEPVIMNYKPMFPSLTTNELMIPVGEDRKYRVNVIDVMDGTIKTGKGEAEVEGRNGYLLPNPSVDILPLVVIDRYEGKHVGRGFVRGFRIRNGAISSSIAHDSHNIIAVGSDHDQMLKAINRLSNTGGICAVSGPIQAFLPLPIAGLMSTRPCEKVAGDLKWIKDVARLAGCTLESPVITLSFLSLLVIPHLKLSDRGLFDTEKFDFIDVIKD
jgi:adenine deaminase